MRFRASPRRPKLNQERAPRPRQYPYYAFSTRTPLSPCSLISGNEPSHDSLAARLAPFAAAADTAPSKCGAPRNGALLTKKEVMQWPPSKRTAGRGRPWS